MTPSSSDKTAPTAVLSADFETAIASTGFGAFNIALLLVALPAAVATAFETSTISYVLPSAECDLKLNLLDKGALYAIPYAGIVTSSLMWGYLADSRGRKQILVYGFLADTLCVLGAAMSQSTTQLLIFKYLGGFVICGPYAVLMSYLTEFHGKHYRGRILMSVGIMMTVATLILPALALIILPRSWSFTLAGLNFNTWRIFITITAVPSLLSGLFFTRFPESPKFLMSLGRNTEALQIFQMIYAKNSGNLATSYAITELENEPKTSSVADELNFAAKLRASRKQLAPLFRKPYLGLSLQVYLINFCILVGQSTVTLWLPQLFATISEFERSSTMSPSMCAILEYSVNKTSLLDQNLSLELCQLPIPGTSYTNNIIVGLASILGYLVAVSLVASIGERWILVISSTLAGCSGIALYWSATALSTLITSAIFVSMGNIAITTIINASVNLFPTLLRTIVVSQSSMFGRCGSLLGNICFPIFMSFGCIPPFLLISSVMFMTGFLSYFLPQTKNISLK